MYHYTMPLYKIQDIKNHLATGKTLLGLDVGSKTIGLALADSALKVATPLETLHRTKFTKDMEKFTHILTERNVGALIVGLPVNMEGTEGPRSQSIRTFAQNVLKTVDLPLAFWDERLSTAAMEREMIAHDVTRARRAKAVDKLAALYILQGALERINDL